MCKVFCKVLLTLFLISFFNYTTLSQSTDYQPEDFLLDNSSLGTDFWVAIPQNGASAENLKEQDISLYISSPYQTSVLVENKALGISKNITIQPYTISRVNIGTNLEVTETENVTHQGIHVTSEKPVMVYAVNVKQYSGEGFMAIPTHALGLKYYHCSFYDFHGTRTADKDYYRSGGFVVVATQDATHLKIKVNGLGGDAATTKGGTTIGTLISETLQAGDTYDLRGDGKTRMKFDLSGTEISADKPIGVISFHERTMLPQDCYEDRDNLIDMLMPVDKWGKDYVSAQMDREKKGNQGDGDMFRVMACEANTDVECEFFDFTDFRSLGVRKPNLKSAGSFATYDDPEIVTNGNKKTTIRGTSRWQSTKPFQLIQYAFSYPWDDDRNWSPMMIVIPPIEQFVSNTLVFAPDLQNINMNRTSLTLFAVGDPDDPNATLLKSIQIDGRPITTISSPSIISSNIEGTNIYWTRVSLDVDNKVHVITSDTKLAGYHCMLGYANSLGWPIGMGTNVINDGSPDVSVPVLQKTFDCGNYTVTATDNGANDKGISKILLLESASENYVLQLDRPEDFMPNVKISSKKFYLTVLDRNLPATAAYAVLDRGGNIIFDTINYIPETAEYNQEKASFGKIRINNEVNIAVKLTNTSNETISVNELSLATGTVYTLGTVELPAVLDPGGELAITIVYKPVKESATTPYYDTLTAFSDCNDYSIPLEGYCIAPHISVEDFHFGSNIEIYTSKCIEDINNEGLRISNNGSDTLTVQSITGVTPPFTISEPTTPPMPFDIFPGKEVYLKSICFVPNDTTEHSIELTLLSNAAGTNDDNKALIRAKAWQKPEEAVDENGHSTEALQIIPNPGTDEEITVNFYANGTNHASMVLFDAAGNEAGVLFDNIAGQGWNKVNLEAGRFPAGLYMVRLVIGSRVYTEKLILY